jgi:hypothetical protein
MDADLGVQTSSRECFSGKVLAEDVGGDYETHLRRKLCMGSGSYALLLFLVCLWYRLCPCIFLLLLHLKFWLWGDAVFC